MNRSSKEPAQNRLYLSPPDLGDAELAFVHEAFDENWIAPVGPHIDAFEQEICEYIGGDVYAAALNSGTAALHIALQLAGVGAGDEVLCSTFTFVAAANVITYVGAKPVFIDSDDATWNMDPKLLAAALKERRSAGKTPKAVILVHLYGQSADMEPILLTCQEYGVPLIEDAAEALGSTYAGKALGTFGDFGVYSFNGNKIITTSAGGMLIARDADAIKHARSLASQARDPAPHYEHSRVGYNYRMSNVLAGIGRAQLASLPSKVASRQLLFARYQDALGDLPGIGFIPANPKDIPNRWLSCITIDPQATNSTPEQLRLALEEVNVESRPLWKPMHLQPLFAGAECYGGAVSEKLFRTGLCLPSGSSITDAQFTLVAETLCANWK